MWLIIYMILGYLAASKVLYENKIYIGDPFNLFMKKIAYGLILGWALIPIAIIKCILQSKR